MLCTDMQLQGETLAASTMCTLCMARWPDAKRGKAPLVWQPELACETPGAKQLGLTCPAPKKQKVWDCSGRTPSTAVAPSTAASATAAVHWMSSLNVGKPSDSVLCKHGHVWHAIGYTQHVTARCVVGSPHERKPPTSSHDVCL